MTLNCKFNSIKFTDVQRKATNMNRVVISESQHSYQHKMPVLSCLVDILANFPMTPVRYKKELTLAEKWYI